MNTDISGRRRRRAFALVAALLPSACGAARDEGEASSTQDEINAAACSAIGDASTWSHNNLFAAEQLTAFMTASAATSKGALVDLVRLAAESPGWLYDLGTYASSHRGATISDFLANATPKHPRLQALHDAAAAAGTGKVLDDFVAWVDANPIAAQRLATSPHPAWLACASGHIPGATAQIAAASSCATDAACVGPDYPAASDGLGRDTKGATLRCRAAACVPVMPPTWRDGLPVGSVDLTYVLEEAKGCTITVVPGFPDQNGDTYVLLRLTGTNPGALSVTYVNHDPAYDVPKTLTGPVDDNGKFSLVYSADYGLYANVWGSFSGRTVTGRLDYRPFDRSPVSCPAMSGKVLGDP